MNKDLAELSVLAVDHLYGKLISAVYSVLAYHGQQTLGGIARILNWPPKQVRTTLVLLVQYHVVYHFTEEGSRTLYFANEEQAYLVCFRTSKLANIVQDRFGKEAAEVLIKIATLGNAYREDVERAFGLLSPRNLNNGSLTASTAPSQSNEADEVTTNGDSTIVPNGTHGRSKTNSSIHSLFQLNHILDQLLSSGFLVKATEHQYMMSSDKSAAADREAHDSFYKQGEGPKNAKEKAAHAVRVEDLKRKWRDAATEDAGFRFQDSGRKRRRLLDDDDDDDDDPMEDDDFRISENINLRINFDKASVLHRNAQLTMLVERYIGETTAKVYEAVLHAQEHAIPFCWDDLEPPELLRVCDKVLPTDEYVTAEAILQHLDPSINLKDDLNAIPQTTSINGHASQLSGDDDDDPPDRMYLLERHLNLLVNDSRLFLKVVRRGVYAVPYHTLTRFLIQNTINEHVEARFGPLATRIIRLLSINGTQDEKFLAQTGILQPKETRALTNLLLKSGLIDTQEVPRDINRTAARVIWLYAYDPRRVRRLLLGETYVAMRNCLHIINTQRGLAARVLEKAEQHAGSHGPSLTENEAAKLKTFRVKEEKLLVMLGRLDDFVGCLEHQLLPMGDMGISPAMGRSLQQ